MNERIFDPTTYTQFNDQAATVIEITKTENSSIAIWAVKPGQVVTAHYHPNGQDTWIVLQGTLNYLLGEGQMQPLTAGEMAIADQNQVHGAINNSNEDAVFVSIYSAPDIGFVKVNAE
jgi:quercetin dioxygenase-like cupin family protein